MMNDTNFERAWHAPSGLLPNGQYRLRRPDGFLYTNFRNASQSL
jgi:hypothetical protein